MAENTLHAPASAHGGAAPDNMKMKKLAMASSVGTTLEWYDFTIYNLMAALVFNAIFFRRSTR